jgi:TP901 family phage tail tape measure protein
MSSRVISIVLRGDVTGLVTSLRTATGALNETGRRMTAATAEGERFRGGLTAVGNTAGKVGLVAAAGMGAAIKAAMDWESAWAGVTKTVDGTASQLDTLEGGLRGLAKELPSTHEEIAAVAEAAGQLGVARGDVVDFTEVMLKLAMSTDLDASTAATSISQLMNVMGTAPDQVDEFAATLVALGNDGASTESQIVQMAQRIAGAAATVGLSEGEVLAFANTVASMGIEVEAGGTAVSTVIATMSRATQSGGEKLDSFASTAGMSAEAFAKSFKEAPAEAMVSFIDGLARTQKAGGNLYAQLDAVGLSDIRVSQALIGMASSGDLLTDSLKLQGEAWSENSALNDEVAKRLATSSAQSKIAMNGIRDAAIELGEAGLPVLSAVADKVSAVSGFFGRLSDPVQAGALAMAGFTAAVGASTFAASRAVSAYTASTGALTNMGLSASAARGAMMRVGAAGIGVGLAAAASSIDDTNTSLNTLTNAAAGAAIGFSVAGPWGAAIGGGVGLLRGLTGGGDMAKASLEGLTATLDEQTGAITENTAKWATKSLQDSGAAGVLADLGISLETATSAVLGNADALDKVGAASKGASFEQAQALVQILGLKEGIVDSSAKYIEGKKAADGAADATGAVGEAAGEAATEVESLSDALNGLLDPLLDQDEATVAWRRSIASLTEDLVKNGGGLDVSTKAGRDNRDAIRSRIEDLKASVNADAEAGVGAEKLGQKMLRGAEGIVQAGAAAGISEKEMRKYIDRLGLTPDQIDTIIAAQDKATPKIEAVKGGLGALSGIKATPSISLKTGGALGTISGIAIGLHALDGTVAHTKTVHKTEEQKAGGGEILRAAGGPIHMFGGYSADNVPHHLKEIA